MEDNSHSIYDLVTKLCGKYINEHPNQIGYPRNVDIKKVRSKCFEILLSKKLLDKSVLEELENNTDPLCHLLAWQFQLESKYKLPEHAEKLRICCEKLQHLDAFSNTTARNLILLMLQLRGVPKGENRIMEVTLNKYNTDDLNYCKSSTTFPYFDKSKFRLPKEPSLGPQLTNDNFTLPNKKIVVKTVEYANALNFIHNQLQRHKLESQYSDAKTLINKDEGYVALSRTHLDETTKLNIWEVVSQEPRNEHRTWEEFGSASSVREPPFLCEAGPHPAAVLQNLLSFDNFLLQNYDGNENATNIITHEQFIKDAKFLLVGMESRTFTYNDKKELQLVRGTCLKGLSSIATKSYCHDLLFCSLCYKGLSGLCTPNVSKNHKQNGYIFAELCESIKHYLSYYHVAILFISDKTRLLAFHEHTRQLRTHITVLASVCKVGPFTETEQIPHGVALLNYLYQKVMSLTNKDVTMVLYSVLYPCCQVYFSRFLQQWILEGAVQDPYGEFFINVNKKYVASRGRTYWTRSYTLREDIVPDFLMDMRTDILLCGKAMNLLKVCVPNSSLCLYLSDKRPDIISCCVMAEQLLKLETNNHYYYLEATALSGPRISLSQTITCCHEQEDLFLSLVAKKRAATLTRIELERKNRIQRQFDKKRDEMQRLQEQYAEARQQKQIRTAEDCIDGIKAMEEDMRMKTLHNRIIEEEAGKLIEYYNKLFETSDNRRAFFERRLVDLKKVQLDGGEILKKHQRLQPPENLPKQSEHSANETLIELSAKISRDLVRSTTSTDTFHSTGEVKENNSEEFISAASDESTHGIKTIHSDADFANANLLAPVDSFEEARRNRAKVLGFEFGIFNQPPPQMRTFQGDKSGGLTDAQRNKLRVLSSEYGYGLTQVQKEQLGNAARLRPKRRVGKKERNLNGKSKCGTPQEEQTEVEVKTLDLTEVEVLKLASTSEKTDTENNNELRLTDTEQPTAMECLNGHPKEAMLKVKKDNNKNLNSQNAETPPVVSSLTAAQKNKIKVMSCTTFGPDMNIIKGVDPRGSPTTVQINRNKMISSHECLCPPNESKQNKNKNNLKNTCDNANFLNKNFISANVNVDNTILVDNMLLKDSDKNSNLTNNWAGKKQDFLSLDFSHIDSHHKPTNEFIYPQLMKSPKFELEKISPMSIGSTPLSNVTTPSNRLAVIFDRSDSESVENPSPATTVTATTSTSAANFETGFNFEINKTASIAELENRRSAYNLDTGLGNIILEKEISVKDAGEISPNCLKLCLQQSIAIPLITQIKLVTNELLKYFINDLHYLKHLNSLKNYFFLLDGEFGRNITEGLFERLYDANFPIELVNCHTLQALVYKALDYSTKFQETSACLSFKINRVPTVFNLKDPDVFDCISLTYKAGWPLNILLPSDAIAKYDDVFKFLLKLHRVSWVLQNLFQDLKSLAKEADSGKVKALMMSPQYRRLHQCRHVMTHFILTLQSYVGGEVLQSSWEIFQKNLQSVTHFDELYSLHTVYIKNILFMCLLNQKSTPLRKAFQKIFTVVLKFYDYLRSRSWKVENGVYMHPNFKKLETIFYNFEELTQYLFKLGHRVAKSGYQPHLLQLLNMLDINNYYSRRSAKGAPLSISSS